MSEHRIRPVDWEVRERAVTDLDTSFCMEAGAGTGKTSILVRRFMEIIIQGRAQCARIAAITFTEKAAAEMKERLRREIARERLSTDRTADERARLDAALEEIDGAPISTIHSFASSILREYALEAGIDPLFGQMDQIEAAILFDSSWEAFLESRSGQHERTLKSWLRAGGGIDRLKSMALYSYQRRGEPALERSAGTLKKEGPDAMAFRDRLYSARKDLARLKSESCLSDDDRGALEIARFSKEISAMEGASGEDLEEMILGMEMPKAKGNANNWDTPSACAAQKETFRAMASELAEFRQEFLENLREGLTDLFEDFENHVERKKSAEGVLDFDDLLIKTRDLLKAEAVADSVRRRYRYILVDEFQDTDPLQAEIILLLCRQPGKLFIVGDPKQSIYRFRRADVEVYHRVKKMFEDTGGALSITQNFRSVPGVTGWVNRAFAGIIGDGGGKAFQPGYEPIIPAREGSSPAVILLETGFGEGKAAEARAAEARAAARFILDSVGSGKEVMDPVTREMRPVLFGDMAMIYRGTTGIEIYEDILRSAGIPYIVEGGGLFYRREEIRSLAAAVHAIEDPNDPVSLVASLRSPLFGFSDEELFLFARAGGRFDYLSPGIDPGAGFPAIAEAFSLLSKMHGERNASGAAGTLRELVAYTGFDSLALLRPHGEQSLLNIRKAVEAARDFDRKGHSFREFALWFREQEISAASEPESPSLDESENAVRLITIHKSKGLQFPVVLMMNLFQRIRPGSPFLRDSYGRISFSLGKGWETPDYQELLALDRERDMAEVARLLYVAATRAGDILVIPRMPGKGSYYEVIEGYLDPGEDVSLVEASSFARLAEERDFSSRLPDPGARPDEALVAERASLLSGRDSLIRKAARAVVSVTPSGAAHIDPGAAAGSAGHEDTISGMGSNGDKGTIAAAGSPGDEGTIAGMGSNGDKGTIAGASAGGEYRSANAAMELGSAFHRFMELAGIPDPSNSRELASRIASEYGIEGGAEVLVGLARQVEASGIWREVAAADSIIREMPFVLPFEAQDGEEARFVEGRIDMLFRSGGVWTVVDYKTDEIDESGIDRRVEDYLPQGALYALALDRLGLRPCAGVVFLFARSGLERKLEADTALLDEAKRIVSRPYPGE